MRTPKPRASGGEPTARAALVTCPRHQRVAALQHLAAAHEPGTLAELAAAIDECASQPEAVWNGLLIAAGETPPRAAVWVQPQPGRTARLWPPRSDSPKAPSLLRGALHWAATQGVQIVQAVIDSSDERAAARLRENGLPQLVDLLYLAAQPNPAQRQTLLAGAPRPGVRFESIGDLPSPRLASLMTQIEDSSLDCPELHGVLSPEQAIKGFRQQGQFQPQHWCILRYQGQDAGVLLLAPHPHTPCWELMYMGILTAWRGQGLGRELVAEALRRTVRDGAEQVLLSVDVRNRPARTLYEQTGFRLYARRSLYAWIAKAHSAKEGNSTRGES